MQLERMGLNEYGKRLEIMDSLVGKKRRRLSANNGFSDYSSLLGAFERRKNGLVLPLWHTMGTARSNSPAEGLERLSGTVFSSPYCLSLARTGQDSRGDPATAMAHVTVIEQNDRSREIDRNVPQLPITGIARCFLVNDGNVSTPPKAESPGELLEMQWMEAKESLKESKQKVTLREVNRNDGMRTELEEYKRRVGEIDRQSYSPFLRATPSSPVVKENDDSQDLLQVADELTSSSGMAVDRPKANELGHKSSKLLPPVWKRMHEESRRLRDPNLKDIAAEIEATRSKLNLLKVTNKEGFLTADERFRDKSEDKESTLSVAFAPLSEDEENEVDRALNGHDGSEVLAAHKKSNIDIRRTVMQCLKPGVWLNDDVINLYLELLKERELCQPEKFLKCHFFSTFFFNKLYKDTHTYNFKAVSRWTTQKKLGYNLLECKKIFVPIHKDIHWCLAVINVQEKKLLYLDSLKGCDRDALRILANYIKDEAKDKLNKILDVNTWDRDCPQDIPEQLNGCDCGMFMIKYADFHSRGDDLNFTQEHMEYFRRRTVLELLRLKAR